MRRLSLLVLVAILVAGYVYRDRWVGMAPTWVASLLRVEPAAARSPPAGAESDSAGGQKRGQEKGGKQVTVTIAAATSGRLPVKRRTIGYVRPLASTTIASETVGLIAEIAVRDGATVKAGDLLARLDDRTARAEVAMDEAALARDQATLDNARTVLGRLQKLVASGAGTKQAGDDQAAIVKSAEATVGLDQATLTAQRVALSKTELRAPFDGRIGAFSVSLGSLVQTGAAIVTITAMAPVYAEFSLPETDLATVRASLREKTLKVEVRPSLAGKDAPAEVGPVVFVDNAVDEASASFRVRAQLPNDDAALWPGQSIDVSVTAGEQDGLVLVPNVAVEPRDEQSIVYLVQPDNTIEVREVTVALRDGQWAGISGGLRAGDKVVTEGQVDLADGTVVREGGDKAKSDAAAAKAGSEAPKAAVKDPA